MRRGRASGSGARWPRPRARCVLVSWRAWAAFQLEPPFNSRDPCAFFCWCRCVAVVAPAFDRSCQVLCFPARHAERGVDRSAAPTSWKRRSVRERKVCRGLPDRPCGGTRTIESVCACIQKMRAPTQSSACRRRHRHASVDSGVMRVVVIVLPARCCGSCCSLLRRAHCPDLSHGSNAVRASPESERELEAERQQQLNAVRAAEKAEEERIEAERIRREEDEAAELRLLESAKVSYPDDTQDVESPSLLLRSTFGMPRAAPEHAQPLPRKRLRQ